MGQVSEAERSARGAHDARGEPNDVIDAARDLHQERRGDAADDALNVRVRIVHHSVQAERAESRARMITPSDGFPRVVTSRRSRFIGSEFGRGLASASRGREATEESFASLTNKEPVRRRF